MDPRTQGRPGGDGLEGLDLPAELVTGEAVALDLRPASFATRALAWLLDLVVLGTVAFLSAWLLVEVGATGDPSQLRAYGVAWFVVVFLVVPTAVETFTRGKSLGKLAAGLRVVRDDGGPVRVRQAFVRALLSVPEIYVTGGSIALICSLANSRGKRLGDLLAGTYVMRERSGTLAPPPPWMPPELAGWAKGADIGRIPDGLALAARQFLQRTTRLHPASRQQLGVRLADRLAGYVAPPPPPGVHPERFLAAVLAERRRRDAERLAALAERAAQRHRRRASAGVLSPAGSRLVGEDAPVFDVPR